MGMQELKLALDLIQRNPDRCLFAGEREETVIKLAEDALGFSFPPTYRMFLERLGAGSFGGEEIYGVIDENFVDSGVPDAVWTTLRGRREWGLPDQLLVVYFDGGTDYFALDTSKRNDDDESPVVVWHPGLSSPDSVPETVASDFGRFLLDTVNDELVSA